MLRLACIVIAYTIILSLFFNPGIGAFMVALFFSLIFCWILWLVERMISDQFAAFITANLILAACSISLTLFSAAGTNFTSSVSGQFTFLNGKITSLGIMHQIMSTLFFVACNSVGILLYSGLNKFLHRTFSLPSNP